MYSRLMSALGSCLYVTLYVTSSNMASHFLRIIHFIWFSVMITLNFVFKIVWRLLPLSSFFIVVVVLRHKSPRHTQIHLQDR